MSKNASKKKQISSRDDFITNRILFIFTFSFALIIGLMFAYRGYSRFDTVVLTSNILLGCSAFGLAVMLVGIVLAVRELKSTGEKVQRVISGGTVAVAGLIIAVCSFFGAMYNIDGVKLMYVFVPAAAAIMLIYLLYSLDLCVIAVVSGVGAAFMWYLSRGLASFGIWERNNAFAGKAFYLVLIALGCIALLEILLVIMKRKGGKLKLFGKERVLFGPRTQYRFCHITSLLTALCVIVAFVVGSWMAYYLIFVLVAWIFVMAVYYTVKLM